jgi:hypothetical protein
MSSLCPAGSVSDRESESIAECSCHGLSVVQ